MIRFIQSNENYLIDKVILMLITGTGFVNCQYSGRHRWMYPAFIEAIADILGKPLNSPAKKA
jgi:hypothetical protein